MLPTVTRGATHLFAKPANWQPEDGECGDLQVRAETFGPNKIVELFSTWKPNADELGMLIKGGVVEIGLCVANQPAMQVGVVDPVEPVLAPYVSHDGTADYASLDGVSVEECFAQGRDPLERLPDGLTINEDAHGHG